MKREETITQILLCILLAVFHGLHFLKTCRVVSDNQAWVSNFLDAAQVGSDSGLTGPKEGELGWWQWLWTGNTGDTHKCTLLGNRNTRLVIALFSVLVFCYLSVCPSIHPPITVCSCPPYLVSSTTDTSIQHMYYHLSPSLFISYLGLLSIYIPH